MKDGALICASLTRGTQNSRVKSCYATRVTFLVNVLLGVSAYLDYEPRPIPPDSPPRARGQDDTDTARSCHVFLSPTRARVMETVFGGLNPRALTMISTS